MKVLFNKKQHQLAERIISNYRIAKNALNDAFAYGKVEGEAFYLAIERITTNTVESLVDIVGINGTIYYTNKYNFGIGPLQ